MRLQDYDLRTQYRATVQRSLRMTAPASKVEVREISFDVEHPGFDASVGQNIGVLAPGQAEFGQEHHFRLYSIADVPETTDAGHLQLRICVRRCNYIDEFSGESYPGVASNYLCDLRGGDTFTLTGPYGQAFELPADKNAALVLICAGTGIAPFRAFVKHIYANRQDFQGRIWLFHGGQTGMDLLYRNREFDDFTLYYERETFEAIDALSKRPGWSDKLDWASALEYRSEQLCQMLTQHSTYVYVAGVEAIIGGLDEAFAKVAGSSEAWAQWKADLQAEGRWIELVY